MTRTSRVRATAILTALLMVGGFLAGWPRAVRPPAKAAEAPSKVVHVDLNIQEKTINVLGVPTTVWTYNGTVPGPTVRVHYGDTLEMTLHNTHNLPHTLHTHFMDYDIKDDGSSATAPFPFVPHQNDDAVSAGAGGLVPGAGNKPGPKVGANPSGPYDPREDEDYVRPGESRTFTWKMLDVGTFWYHCHVMEATNHISKGLFGAIISYPKGWSWEEQPADPLNGNTKAMLTNAKGQRLREDVVIMSEKMPGPGTEGDSAVGLAANGGAAGGPELANMRGWNDPYLIGPFLPAEKGLIHVMNIGETGKSWHLHAAHWYRLWQTWHPWQGYPEWHQTNHEQMDPNDSMASDFDPVPFTPVAELDHTRWISSGEIMPTLIQVGKPGFWFGHDHVVPQAYLGMVPWLVVKAPGQSPEAVKQAQQLQQLHDIHMTYVDHPDQKYTLQGPMAEMKGMADMGSMHPAPAPAAQPTHSMHH